MATAGIQLSLETTDLAELRKALGNVFNEAQKARILKDALTKALQPALTRLRALTPEGPTGNLKRAVSLKVIPYTRSGNAAALIGFTRADKEKAESAQGGRVRRGKDLAYHQYWLEQGTKDRVINKVTPPRSYSRSGGRRGGFSRRGYEMTRNGKKFAVSGHDVSGHAIAAHSVTEKKSTYYASSYNKLGPFKIRRFGRGEKGFITQPDYPRAFFKRSKDPIVIRGMRPGGINGQPPLKTAWEQTRTQVAEILQQELRISLSRALETLVRSSTGTIDAFGR